MSDGSSSTNLTAAAAVNAGSSCGTHRQSPIDIAREHAVTDATLGDIVYSYRHETKAVLTNNGNLPTWHVTPSWHRIRGGPLAHDHELVQYHVHFSADHKKGSEHSIDGQHYPAEMHFVHFNKRYGSLEAALQHPDGLAVVGAFLEVVGLSNNEKQTQLDADISRLKAVACAGSHCVTSSGLPLYGLDGSRYYYYEGSLTTPPYGECVRWIVLQRPLRITHETLQALLSLKSHQGELISDPGNCRTIQPLCGRIVRKTKDVH